MRKSLCFFALAILPFAGHSQQPDLVADINKGEKDAFYLNSPSINWNSILYFAATDTSSNGSANLEYWTYNEKSAPKMLADINPGFRSGVSYDPSSIAIFKRKLLFAAGADGNSVNNTGIELMSYDGINPPKLVADISPIGGSFPNSFLATENELFFAADFVRLNSGIVLGSRDLYRYDNANPPTRIVVGTNPAGAQPRYMARYNANIYFTANPVDNNTNVLMQTNYNGIWDYAKGAGDIRDPSAKIVVGNKMYFAARSTAFGNELYSYDGDTALRLTDIAPGPKDGLEAYPSVSSSEKTIAPAYFNGAIYFSGSTDSLSYQLYRYVIASGATELVKTINPSGSAQPWDLVVHDNALWFTAFSPATGFELWKYDGTTCALYADIYPGPKSAFWSNSVFGNSSPFPSIHSGASFTELNGRLYFKARDSLHGLELWRIGKVPSAVVSRAAWDGEVVASPNPVHSNVDLAITVQKKESVAVIITDAAGRTVYHSGLKPMHAGTNHIDVSMARYAAGMYCFRLNSEDGQTLATGRLERD